MANAGTGPEANNQDATSMAEPGNTVPQQPMGPGAAQGSPVMTNSYGDHFGSPGDPSISISFQGSGAQTPDPNNPGSSAQTSGTGQDAQQPGGVPAQPAPGGMPVHIDPAGQAMLQRDAQAEVNQDNQHSAEVNKALSEGYTQQQISAYLQQSKGMTPADADFSVVDSVAQKVKQATAAGWSPTQIQTYLSQNKYDPNVVSQALKVAGVKSNWTQLEYKNPTPQQQESQQTKAQDLADLYQNVFQQHSDMLLAATSSIPFGNDIVGAFSPAEGLKARADLDNLNLGIVHKLNENGIQAAISPAGTQYAGRVVVPGPNGQMQPVNANWIHGMWNGIKDSSDETLGFAGGSAAGAYIGGALGTMVAPGIGTAVGAVGGSMVGAAVGSMVGRARDLAVNSALLSEKLSNRLYMTQIAQTGLANGVMDVVGAGALKVISAGAKDLMSAYKYTVGGNKAGAVKVLQNVAGISPDQASQIADRWFNSFEVKPEIATKTGVNKLTLGLVKKGGMIQDAAKAGIKSRAMTQEEKIIAAMAHTEPAVDRYANDAAAQNAVLAQNVKRHISDRAAQFNKILSSHADPNIGHLVQSGLNAHFKDVADFYGLVRKAGSMAVDGTDFKFDLNKLAIQPVLEQIKKQIADPAQMERFVGYSTRIANASSVRDFSGLIDLRQAVNDFKYSVAKNLGHNATTAVNDVLARIDKLIAKTAKDYMPDGQQWLKNFTLAKQEYSKMKMLEASSMYRKIMGATRETDIQAALNTHANKLDVDAAAFNQIVDRLPPATRVKVEAAAIQNLVSKNTLYKGTDAQAVDFPSLDMALKDLNLQTPEGKRLAQAVSGIAKIFRNDADLSRITMGTKTNVGGSGIGTNLIERAKVALMGRVFTHIMRYFVPSQALITNIDKLLQNPLNAQIAKDVLSEVPKTSRPEMDTLVKNFQNEFVAAGNKAPVMVHMYNQSADGMAKVTNGQLGRGIYLFDRVKNADPALTTFRHPVLPSRMATLDDIAKMVGRDNVTVKDIKGIPGLQKMLSDKGYLGIKIDNRAMIFAENATTDAAGKEPETAVSEAPKKPRGSKFNQNPENVTGGPDQQAESGNREINDIVKRLNEGTSGADELQQLRARARELGFNVHKRGLNPKTGMGGKWIYNQIKGK